MDYECVSRNRDALFQAVADLKGQLHSAYYPSQHGEDFIYHAINSMNQHVNNFLSSSRAFIDRTETRLKRTYGEASDQFLRFKEQTAHLYDSQFSYRFLYRLRNYSTHCDLPVSNMDVDASRPNETEAFRFKVAFLIDRGKLLTDFHEGLSEQLREEIGALTPRIDLLPLLKEQAEWSRILFRGVLGSERHRIQECHHYMNVLRDGLEKNPHITADEVAVIWQGEGLPSEGVRMTLGVELIPFAQMDRMIGLLMRRGPSFPIPPGQTCGASTRPSASDKA